MLPEGQLSGGRDHTGRFGVHINALGAERSLRHAPACLSPGSQSTIPRWAFASHSSGGCEVPDQGAGQVHSWVRLLLAHRGLPPYRVLTWGGGGGRCREEALVFSYKNTTSIMGLHLHDLFTSKKTHLLLPSYSG